LEAVPSVFSDRPAHREKAAEDLQAQLYQQIGQLKVELDWLKKKSWPGALTSSARPSSRSIPRSR
jgi:hypothetical protein